jgi:hypothetical protein
MSKVGAFDATRYTLFPLAKLAAIGIKDLWKMQLFKANCGAYIYSLVQQIINHQARLFFNRHIDQIILCIIYGVAKVCLNHLTLKIWREKSHSLQLLYCLFIVICRYLNWHLHLRSLFSATENNLIANHRFPIVFMFTGHQEVAVG